MSEDSKITTEAAKASTKAKKARGRRSVKAAHEADLAAAAESSAATDSPSAPATTTSAPVGGTAAHAAAKKSKKKKAECVGDRPIFASAIKQFLRTNTTFESSTATEDAMADVVKAAKLNEVLRILMRHKILNMDGCLRFVLFLYIVGGKPLEDEAAFSGDAKFSATAALKDIHDCFDEGIQETVNEAVDAALDEEFGESGSESD